MRVLIADRRKDVRQALSLLLTQEPGICVVGDASDSQELLVRLEALCPDVVLVDCALPGQPMADLLAEIHTCSSSPQVIVLCSETETRRAALAAGAHTFVDKTEHPKRLLTALRVLQLESDYE